MEPLRGAARAPVWATAITLVLLVAAAAAAAAPTVPLPRAYANALELYRQKRYPEAVAAFEALYQRRQLPRLLCYLGYSHRKLGQASEALHYLDLCLAADSDLSASQREQLKAAIGEVRRSLEVVRRKRAVPAAGSPPVLVPALSTASSAGGPAPVAQIGAQMAGRALPARRPALGAGFWAGMGLALTLASAGAVSGGVALQRYQDLREMPSPAPVGSPDAVSTDDPHGTIRTLTVSTDVLLGAAMLTAGITLIVTLSRRSAALRHTALMPTGPGIAAAF